MRSDKYCYNNKIKVLIIDDSAVVRNTLKDVLESDPQIIVIGTAIDPYHAAEKIKHQVPDVITLDVEMPRMDGVTFLKKIMSQHPIPIVMCSSLTIDGCETTIEALEYGAVDIITKPKLGIKTFLEESRIRIIDSIKAAYHAKVKKMTYGSKKQLKKLTADVILEAKPPNKMIETSEKVVVVGASTGGTEALRSFLQVLPKECPGIVIVQHMPEKFTRSFANRLNKLCEIEVKEAENDDSVMRGRALIAPGNKHILLKRKGARYYTEIKKGPLVCRNRPSVDVLFRSAAQNAGRNTIGVIMTGMGDDGARGMLEIKNTGAHTIVQDEASSIVFGMAKEAIKRDAVDEILPLCKIAEHVLKASVYR